MNTETIMRLFKHLGILALVGCLTAPLASAQVVHNLLDTSKGDFILNTTTLGGIVGPLVRHIPLTDGKSDLGVPMTAAAGTPSGTVGVARTAGTSLALVGETTSSNAKTDKVIFEIILPWSYQAGTNVPLTVNASVTGSGTLTGSSTTITAAFYTEANGVETAQTVSAAQQIVAAGSDLVFTVTGTNLIPGQRCVIELTMLVTTASGANTGSINKVSITG